VSSVSILRLTCDRCLRSLEYESDADPRRKRALEKAQETGWLDAHVRPHGAAYDASGARDLGTLCPTCADLLGQFFTLDPRAPYGGLTAEEAHRNLLSNVLPEVSS
jgi:hypothetical protein